MPTPMRPSRVMILQRALPHYRVPFFAALHQRLQKAGVELRLVYGRPHGLEAAKQDAGHLPWAEQIPLRLLAGERAIWHPILTEALGQDLVISEQANRNLINLALMAARRAGGPRFALWGHGRNHQTGAASAANRIKAVLMHQADGWFAYTASVAAELAAQGYPSERITTVENAIDTRAFAAELAAVSPEEQAAFRQLHELHGPVGLYCGGMYAEKRIPFLIEAADRIHAACPTFSLLAVGAGPDAGLLHDAATTRPWLHMLGPRFGADKARCFAAATVLLMPGLVGLAVLDSFVAQVPMVTTDYPFHSPEITYLAAGTSGLITPDTLEAYAQAVVELLADPEALIRLRQGCQAAAGYYTIERMADNFATGILRILQEHQTMLHRA